MSQLTRREFLKRGAAGCAALGAPFLLKGCGDANRPGPAETPAEAGAAVHVVFGGGPADLYDMGRQAAEALGIRSGTGLSGKSVFIKPNLVVMGLPLPGNPYRPESGECTKAEILTGVAEQCLRAGAARVTIGDAAAGLSWDWGLIAFFDGHKVFGATNLLEAVESLRERHPLQTLDLCCLNQADDWLSIPSSSRHPLLRDGLKIARLVHEADHVISVPVLKTHVLAEFTCSMKNFVGLTPSLPPYGASAGLAVRDQLHVAYADATRAGIEKAGIAACFTDIVRWRKDQGRQDYAIIDCSIGVEGDGPLLSGGGSTLDLRERTPKGKFFLIASKDLLAADTVAALVMGLEPGAVKQLRIAAGLGIGDADNIRLLGVPTLDAVRIRNLVRAHSWQEWGVGSTTGSGRPEICGDSPSRTVNLLAALSVPAGAACALKRIGNRRRESENHPASPNQTEARRKKPETTQSA